MAVKGDILRKILADLKSRPSGASLQDLAYTLPPNYLHMDFDPTYLVFESMLVLMRWGLVEAYDGKRVLNVKDLEGYGRYDWPRDLTFYITKQTTEMEEALGIRLDASAEKIFGETRPGNWPQVLVVMPFADSLRPLYEDHIRGVVLKEGLRVGRADDFFKPGSIIGDIWNAINGADIIVSDLTERNPNVFYETGIAHALGKETILITQVVEDVPFDLRHLRIIKYADSPEGMIQFKSALSAAIKTLVQATRPV